MNKIDGKMGKFSFLGVKFSRKIYNFMYRKKLLTQVKFSNLFENSQNCSMVFSMNIKNEYFFNNSEYHKI